MTSGGRPPCEPTEKDRRVVEMMAGWSIPEERVAKVLRMDPKTLRKHFAEELEVGHARLEAQLAQNLLRIAQGHDRQSLIATIFALKSRIGWVEQQPPAREQPWARRRLCWMQHIEQLVVRLGLHRLDLHRIVVKAERLMRI